MLNLLPGFLLFTIMVAMWRLSTLSAHLPAVLMTTNLRLTEDLTTAANTDQRTNCHCISVIQKVKKKKVDGIPEYPWRHFCAWLPAAPSGTPKAGCSPPPGSPAERERKGCWVPGTGSASTSPAGWWSESWCWDPVSETQELCSVCDPL